MSDPQVSIVIPVYNEEQTLPLLFARLYPALDKLGVSYDLSDNVMGYFTWSKGLSAAKIRPAHRAVL